MFRLSLYTLGVDRLFHYYTACCERKEFDTYVGMLRTKTGIKSFDIINFPIIDRSLS
jgi:hypothetical protein